MKIDFIHIGYHRTASSWLQVCVFPRHPDIVMCNVPNTPLGFFFVENFVEVSDFDFNCEVFRRKFSQMIEQRKGWLENKVYGISEENITGHFWNGFGSKMLADRVKEVFGDTKIIIFVRNQYDMLSSLYSNYIKSGGTKSMMGLINDMNMFGKHVISKLCYHKLIEYYIKLFSRENVLILCYEDLVADKVMTVNKIFHFLGVKPIQLPDKILNRKVNPGLSIPTGIILRCANFLNFNLRYSRKLMEIIDKYVLTWANLYRSRKVTQRLLSKGEHEQFKQSNKILQRYIDQDLKLHDYLL